MAKQSRIAHFSDVELNSATAKSVAAQYYNGNVGAAWNAIDTLKKQRSNGSEPAKLAEIGVKTVAARVTPSITAKAQEPAKLTLPGRIEDFMIDHVLPDSWDDEKPIPRHFVEMVVISDTPDWNKRVRRLGPDELTMLEAFLGAGATMNRREDALLEKQARAPFERAQARIDAQAQIDALLESAASRFDSMRYDAAIVAAYA